MAESLTKWGQKTINIFVLTVLYTVMLSFLPPMALQKKTNAVKEKIKKKYEDMKRVLDEDLRITLTQLDTEHEATEKLMEERIEDCYHLTQELDQELANISAQVKKDTQEGDMQVNTNPKL